ncbi:polysaccharide deacetylase family protein [Candidatus Woesearchaeota archaeon]|nr:polysaccharide deacetylase family protein [Candidatus Woesearchaeota archaeon]
MVSVCLYFQVHQPYRIRNFTVFDIGNRAGYFDDEKNTTILKRVASKCYLPSNKVILELLDTHPEFKASFSLSGTVLEQLEKNAPEALDSFKELAKTGRVELLDETYYHSLAFIYSKKEFQDQVKMHSSKIRKMFGKTPTVFRNTELIYNNEIANFVEKMGYKGVIAEGADHILGWRSPNFLYRPKTAANGMKLLLKNYKLSDDVAFRFSERSWSEWPLTADKFASWVSAINGNGVCANLFMDYETFGEHQWEETGIFNFLRHMPGEILKHPDNDFRTPGELVGLHEPVGEMDIHNLISWADIERDLSAWLGNSMQHAAIRELYGMEQEIKESGDQDLLEEWRRLQTSDHFYYMCTKWFSDGDVHKYFNPYDSPYDAFISYMNIINDLKIRLKTKKI